MHHARMYPAVGHSPRRTTPRRRSVRKRRSQRYAPSHSFAYAAGPAALSSIAPWAEAPTQTTQISRSRTSTGGSVGNDPVSTGANPERAPVSRSSESSPSKRVRADRRRPAEQRRGRKTCYGKSVTEGFLPQRKRGPV
jgi:hypothetical protein